MDFRLMRNVAIHSRVPEPHEIVRYLDTAAQRPLQDNNIRLREIFMNMLFWVAAFIGLAFLSRAASAVSAAPKFTTDDSEASSADTSYSSADVDDRPSFNIDGTPMMGMLDVHGRVYGDISSTDDLVIHAVDDTWTHDSLWDSSSSSMFDDTFSSSHSWD